MRVNNLIGFVLFTCIALIHQHKQYEEETLYSLNGGVYNDNTNQPVEVNSTVVYKTLPFGNDIGVTHLRPGFDYYIKLKKSKTYKIQVKAKGFATSSKIVEPNQESISKESIRLDFRLKPIEVGQLIELRKLKFAQGKADILKDAFNDLEDLYATLTENPKIKIRIEGHTDIDGSAELNMKLSKLRVEKIEEFLINKGIDKNRIETDAFGEAFPLVKHGTEEERSVNRRVEIRITSI